MHKVKGIRAISFITFLTLGITIFLVYASTTNSLMDSEANLKTSQLSKSTKNNAIKNNPESSTLNIEQLPDVSSEMFVDQRIALLNEQVGDDRNVISRGTRNINTYYKINEIEKSITPFVELANPSEVEFVTPTESTETAAATEVESAALAEPTRTAVQSAATVEAAETTFTQLDTPAKATSSTVINTEKTTEVQVNSQYEKDLDVLARLITAEAQGEPYEAQVAVGAVVLNRVESGLWADTIKGVIYQNINGYYQFTPVVNGWINKPAQSESIKAAMAAMNGTDPTNGAQFYYDDKCTNTWILSKPVSIQIGHMIYAY